jgi:hypothetical protein
MSDRLSPAWVATLVAVPVALAGAVVSVWLFSDFRTQPSRAGSTARPQATTPVSMPAAPLDDQRATACRNLVDHLPPALRDRPRRPVTAGTDQNAAYGDPPLTVSCGGAAVTMPTGATVYQLSGVCWYAQSAGDGTVWTTVDRGTPVRVTVPGSYDSPGQWVVEFSAPVSAALSPIPTPPGGC